MSHLQRSLMIENTHRGVPPWRLFRVHAIKKVDVILFVSYIYECTEKNKSRKNHFLFTNFALYFSIRMVSYYSMTIEAILKSR